jgi:hypothetical protein
MTSPIQPLRILWLHCFTCLKLSKALRASRALFEDPRLYPLGPRLPGRHHPGYDVIARAALLLSALPAVRLCSSDTRSPHHGCGKNSVPGPKLVHSRSQCRWRLSHPTIANVRTPMQASEIHDYASRLLKDHGDKAQLIAAQGQSNAKSAAIKARLRTGGEFATRSRRCKDRTSADPCKPLLRLRQIHARPSGHAHANFELRRRSRERTRRDAAGGEFRRSPATSYSQGGFQPHPW